MLIANPQFGPFFILTLVNPSHCFYSIIPTFGLFSAFGK